MSIRRRIRNYYAMPLTGGPWRNGSANRRTLGIAGIAGLRDCGIDHILRRYHLTLHPVKVLRRRAAERRGQRPGDGPGATLWQAIPVDAMSNPGMRSGSQTEGSLTRTLVTPKVCDWVEPP